MYRFDKRTKEQFKKDIKSSSVKEAEIALRICLDVKINEKKDWPILLPNRNRF